MPDRPRPTGPRIRTQANEAPPPRKGLESELLDPSLVLSVHFDVSDEATMPPSARAALVGHRPEKEARRAQKGRKERF